MESSVGVIGDVDTVTGFKLGGIKKSYDVKTDKDAKNALDKLIDDKISIIIITEKIADNIREYINKKIGSNTLPMLIEIPNKYGSSEKDVDPIGELIKRVIGVEMVR